MLVMSRLAVGLSRLRPLRLAARPISSSARAPPNRPVERRIDPQDGMPYTEAQFISHYGHTAVWRRAKLDMPAERRVDPQDGRPYTQDEFVAHYGGDAEWLAAHAVDAASTCDSLDALAVDLQQPGGEGDGVAYELWAAAKHREHKSHRAEQRHRYGYHTGEEARQQLGSLEQLRREHDARAARASERQSRMRYITGLAGAERRRRRKKRVYANKVAKKTAKKSRG